MKIKRNFDGVVVLEKQIPALRTDQEGKLLGGFSAIAGIPTPADTNGICGIKFICKGKCSCPVTTTAKPSEDKSTPSKNTKNANAAGFDVGLSMLF